MGEPDRDWSRSQVAAWKLPPFILWERDGRRRARVSLHFFGKIGEALPILVSDFLGQSVHVNAAFINPALNLFSQDRTVDLLVIAHDLIHMRKVQFKCGKRVLRRRCWWGGFFRLS